MRDNLVQTIGKIGQDNLLARIYPPAEVTGVTIRAAAEETVYPRGAVLALSSLDNNVILLGETSNAPTTKVVSGIHIPVAEDNTALIFADVQTDTLEVSWGDTELVADTDYTAAVADSKCTITILSDSTAYDNAIELTVGFTANLTAADETLTPAYILCDETIVGTEEDVTAVAYRTGCFNSKAVIVADGYALTAADRDALRKYGIVFNDNMQR